MAQKSQTKKRKGKIEVLARQTECTASAYITNVVVYSARAASSFADAGMLLMRMGKVDDAKDDFKRSAVSFATAQLPLNAIIMYMMADKKKTAKRLARKVATERVGCEDKYKSAQFSSMLLDFALSKAGSKTERVAIKSLKRRLKKLAVSSNNTVNGMLREA